MSAVASWILSILTVVLMGTMLDIFLSEKKLAKSVRSVVASLLVLLVIAPIPAMLSGLGNLGEIFSGETVKLDENFLEYANARKLDSLQKGVESAYEQAGYKNILVKITAKIDTTIEISAVKIIISDMVIDNPALNINKIERIVDLCVEFLGVERAIVAVVQ